VEGTHNGKKKKSNIHTLDFSVICLKNEEKFMTGPRSLYTLLDYLNRAASATNLYAPFLNLPFLSVDLLTAVLTYTPDRFIFSPPRRYQTNSSSSANEPGFLWHVR